MKLEVASDICELKGVGSTVAEKLSKLGISTVQDLIYHFPRKYDDYSYVVPIAKAKPGTITIKGVITRVASRRTRRTRNVTEAVLEDDTGSLKLVWFNQAYLARQLPMHQPVYVAGSLEYKYGRYAMQNPSVEKAEVFTRDTARIVPVYRETAGLNSRQLRKLVSQIIPVIDRLPDILPAGLSRQEDLLPRSEALLQIHFPSDQKRLQKARRTLAFEELFILILTGLVIKSGLRREPATPIPFEQAVADRYTGALPFALTQAQRKAAWQILQDIGRTEPMNRLLEGDVGSGKTAVAAFAMVMAAHHDLQTVLLAPTEVLARQHFETLRTLLAGFQLDIGLLTGGTKKVERKELLDALRSGTIGVLVGTHAILEPDVEFANLGMVVVDEQHRFGVEQRRTLRAKAGSAPHFLSMSATPIPRSLALTVYGDLDISVLDELPPGRKPVMTRVIPEPKREDMNRHVDGKITEGHQVFVICPLIDDSDKSGAKSVAAESRRLAQAFPERTIATLNGRMKPVEKQEVVERFRSGETDILVSTTVVEVGVDIPNANIMIIEGAERFGLATLHQLRGRVGRGGEQAYCWLLTTQDRQSRQRLQLLEKYNDGFTLAEEDLELRGPGELYGKLQTGSLDLRIATLADHQLIADVRQVATEWLKHNTLDDFPELASRVKHTQVRHLFD